jgi:hypothetical protein
VGCKCPIEEEEVEEEEEEEELISQRVLYWICPYRNV